MQILSSQLPQELTFTYTETRTIVQITNIYFKTSNQSTFPTFMSHEVFMSEIYVTLKVRFE